MCVCVRVSDTLGNGVEKKSGGLKTIYTLMLNGILVNADGMLGGCSIRSAARKEHHHFCNCYTQNVQLLCGF